MNNNTTTLEQVLKILVKELDKADVRKYTCTNNWGYSQLERDIVEKITNWQKEQVELVIEYANEVSNQLTLKYKALLESHNELLKAAKYAYALLHQHPDGQFALCVNDLRKSINKTKNI